MNDIIDTERKFAYRNKTTGKWLDFCLLVGGCVAYEVDIVFASSYRARNIIEEDFNKIKIFYENDEGNIVNKREDYELVEIKVTYETI